MARRKRFNIEKSARSFSEKVDGKVNDCRNIEGAKSPFTVTYQPNEKTKKHGQGRFYEPEFCRCELPTSEFELDTGEILCCKCELPKAN